MRSLHLTLFILLLLHRMHVNNALKKSLVNNVSDLKDFKKLLRSKTNVLAIFVNRPKVAQDVLGALNDAAYRVKGVGTIVQVNCNNSDSKKVCKKYKIDPAVGFCIKHFKDGEFHKDYDRAKKVSAFENFLQDPTGDIPWEEDPIATSMVHLLDAKALKKFLKKGQGSFKNSLIMFYAPWCGYCKRMKPDFAQAASELKGEGILAAIDVTKPGNTELQAEYNITGFPTLLYFERGVLKFPYNGENKLKAFVQFMKDPTSVPPRQPPQDEGWSTDSDVLHLTADTFDKTVNEAESVLVAFYAPWCGHCKQLKPQFEKAATELKNFGGKGILAAVDGSKEAALIAKYEIQGYPSIKYFEKGEFKYDAGHLRDSNKILAFMKDPQPPPPAPPAEAPWSEEVSNVVHLNSTNFQKTLRKVQHALVMFYAPWCGHCKSAKPEIVEAADQLAEEYKVMIAAVDCTVEKICGDYSVQGFPTFKYFSFFDKIRKDYMGGRTSKDFVSFIRGEIKHWSRQIREQNSERRTFESDVIHLTDETFEAYIGEQKPTFIMFYTTWCGNCGVVKPAFLSASLKLVEEKSPIRFAAVDCTDNNLVADVAEIQTIPTFKLYKNSMLIATYDGSRTEQDFIKFAKSKSGGLDRTEL